MEYTDYYVVKDDLGKLQTVLEELTDEAIIMDDAPPFFPFVGDSLDAKKLIKKFDWLLSVFDAEGGAWGFELNHEGESVGSATWGENSEWGIDSSMNGFEGDLEKTAEVLGTTSAKLQSCFDDGWADEFCALVGFEHRYMLYPRDLPPGVMLISDLM